MLHTKITPIPGNNRILYRLDVYNSNPEQSSVSETFHSPLEARATRDLLVKGKTAVAFQRIICLGQRCWGAGNSIQEAYDVCKACDVTLGDQSPPEQFDGFQDFFPQYILFESDVPFHPLNIHPENAKPEEAVAMIINKEVYTRHCKMMYLNLN